MAEKALSLDTKNVLPEALASFQTAIQGNDILDPQNTLESMGLLRTADHPKWGKANYGVLDRAARKIGIMTEGLKLDEELANLQAPYLQLIDAHNADVRKRLQGPTQGQVTEQGLASQVGVPFSYTGPSNLQPPMQPTETLTPSPTHPGAMQLGGTTNLPQYAEQPNRPLDPLQAMKLHAIGQRMGAAPVQPNEAAIAAGEKQRMVDILVKQGMDPDKAALEVYGSKGHLYNAGSRPGTPEGAIKEAEAANAPDKYYQDWRHTVAQTQKLNSEMDIAEEKAPEALNHLRAETANLRSQIKERGKGLEERLNLAKQRAETAEERAKLSERLTQVRGILDAIGRLDMSRVGRQEAEVLAYKLLGLDFETDPRAFFDPGLKDKQLTNVNPISEAGTPKIGTVKKGYRFKGGNPSKQESWEKVP